MTDQPEYSTQTAYDLIDAFQREGCPVCSLALKSVAHYMESINYDGVSDQGFREQMKQALGFCNNHAYQWLQLAFVLGTAQMYRDILNILVMNLREQTADDVEPNNHIVSLLLHHENQSTGDTIIHPAASCPACAHLAETEAMLVSTLVSQLDMPAFLTAYLASTGLCIPHLRMAFSSPASTSARNALRDHALKTEEHLIAQLDEIIRKHDYRFRQELVGNERGAASRAVAHVAGAKRITKLQII
ncbi:MAG TPA: DUF6062 family protein [Thermomicrobiales bacterium]|nr:DUF6062 family protein [Thermomicrobiales bacterium]